MPEGVARPADRLWRAHSVTRDPQRVADESFRATHLVLPEVGIAVNHRQPAGPGLELVEKSLDPSLEIRGRQTAGLLKVNDGRQRAWNPLRSDGVGEIGSLHLGGRVARPGVVVGAAIHAGRCHAAPIRREEWVRVAPRLTAGGTLGGLDEGKGLAAAADLCPIDCRAVGMLVTRHIGPRELRGSRVSQGRRNQAAEDKEG